MKITTNKEYPRAEQQQDDDKNMSDGQRQAGKTVASLREVFGTWNKHGEHKAHRNPSWIFCSNAIWSKLPLRDGRRFLSISKRAAYLRSR